MVSDVPRSPLARTVGRRMPAMPRWRPCTLGSPQAPGRVHSPAPAPAHFARTALQGGGGACGLQTCGTGIWWVGGLSDLAWHRLRQMRGVFGWGRLRACGGEQVLPLGRQPSIRRRRHPCRGRSPLHTQCRGRPSRSAFWRPALNANHLIPGCSCV